MQKVNKRKEEREEGMLKGIRSSYTSMTLAVYTIRVRCIGAVCARAVLARMPMQICVQQP